MNDFVLLLGRTARYLWRVSVNKWKLSLALDWVGLKFENFCNWDFGGRVSWKLGSQEASTQSLQSLCMLQNLDLGDGFWFGIV